MDLIKTLEIRKSCRKYLDKTIAEDLIKQISWAGSRAPYASGGPRREFYFILDKEKREQIWLASYKQPYVKECNAIAVVCGKDIEGGTWDSRPKEKPKTVMQSGHAKYIFDVSASAMCMDLMAHSLGLGTCWIGHFDWKEVQKVIESKERPVMLLLLGYPDLEWQKKYYKNPKALGYKTNPWGDEKEVVFFYEDGVVD